MKNWITLLLCIMLLIGTVGCGAADVEVLLPEDEPVQEIPLPEKPEEEVPAEEEPAEMIPEEPAAEEGVCVGIWSSENGIQTDPVTEYHNYYVCLFENGSAIRFGWRLMDLGSWSFNQNGEAEVLFDQSLSLGQEGGWERSSAVDQVTYAYDAGSHSLLQLSCLLDDEFSMHEAYYPANRTDAYENTMTHIGYYRDYGTLNWMTQMDMNAGTGMVAAMYNGLEQLIYSQAVQKVSEEETAKLEQQEQEWREKKEQHLDSIYESYDGGTIAAMMANNSDRQIVMQRIKELLPTCGPNARRNVFANLPETFWFSSGAGGWATEISVASDGKFTGLYSDSDMGDVGKDYPNGTVYICRFSGAFSQTTWINEYVCSLQLDHLDMEQAPDQVYYEDGIRYICTEPYGLDNAGEFLMYLPGMPVSEMPQEFLYWAQIYPLQEKETMPSGWYGLFNVGGAQGFVGKKQAFDLTQGCWYNYSEQSANCTEYVFSADGTVTARGRDVMSGSGEYQDVLYKDNEMYAPWTAPYSVDTNAGTVTIGETVWNMDFETGRLVREYTETWNPGVVFSTYLQHYSMVPSLKDMILDGSRYVEYFSMNAQVLN